MSDSISQTITEPKDCIPCEHLSLEVIDLVPYWICELQDRGIPCCKTGKFIGNYDPSTPIDKEAVHQARQENKQLREEIDSLRVYVSNSEYEHTLMIAEITSQKQKLEAVHREIVALYKQGAITPIGYSCLSDLFPDEKIKEVLSDE